MISAPRESGGQEPEDYSPGNYTPGDVAAREISPRDIPDEEVLSPRTPGLIHMKPDSETDPHVPSRRSGARAAAMQALYEAESTGHPARTAVDQIAERDDLPDRYRAFATRLVEAVESDRLALDARIGELAPARPVERIDRIDRAILRLALAELSLEGDDLTPPAVIANEAVELARLYGSETSPRFINGVLGTVLR